MTEPDKTVPTTIIDAQIGRLRVAKVADTLAIFDPDAKMKLVIGGKYLEPLRDFINKILEEA